MFCQNADGTDVYNEGNRKVCYKCGAMGHVKADCPSA